jgi:hypothetical protein
MGPEQELDLDQIFKTMTVLTEARNLGLAKKSADRLQDQLNEFFPHNLFTQYFVTRYDEIILLAKFVTQLERIRTLDRVYEHLKIETEELPGRELLLKYRSEDILMLAREFEIPEEGTPEEQKIYIMFFGEDSVTFVPGLEHVQRVISKHKELLGGSGKQEPDPGPEGTELRTISSFDKQYFGDDWFLEKAGLPTKTKMMKKGKK